MIKAKLLNSDAELNDFHHVGSVEFIPGENLRISLQIFLSEKNIRYVPPATAELTLVFKDKDGDDIVKTAAVIDADDRSMWFVELTQAETEELEGQSIEGTLDVDGDGDPIFKFILNNVLQRINLGGDC